MTQAGPRPRPPWLAAWLVELFASAEQAESILGDLHEEFSDVDTKSGVVAAGRWYWRQSVKTIFHLFGAAFHNSPWSMAGIVLLGFLIDFLSARLQLPENVIMAILHAQRPYSNLSLRVLRLVDKLRYSDRMRCHIPAHRLPWPRAEK